MVDDLPQTADTPVHRCPKCGRSKVSDIIGHRHTGHQCFWCGFNDDDGPLMAETSRLKELPYAN